MGKKIRIHGDFHLGQVLCVENDLCFLDFEGEASRTLAEKRRKYSPLRDVAGMLRSFDYAVHVAARNAGKEPEGCEALHARLSSLYLETYYAGMESSGLLPSDMAARDALLRLFVLEKAVYELDYELNNRPDWAEIPLRGLSALAS